MKIISTIAERKIRKAQEEGLFDGLQNAGRPLNLQDDTWVPEDLRLAYRMLRNAGFLPPELELRNEIINLRGLIETIDDDRERLKRLRQLNYKIMCLNSRRALPFMIEDFPEYEERFHEKLAGL
jgi:hypothetical protein